MRIDSLNLEDFQLRITEKYPKENIEIVEYNGYKQHLKVKCKKCNNVYEFKTACSILSKSKQNVCRKCNPNIWTTLKTLEEKKKYFKEWTKNQNKFKVISSIDTITKIGEPIELQCLNCGAII